MKKIAVFPLYKDDSAYFEIIRTCLKQEGVKLIDFKEIEYCFSEYKKLDAIFLNFYEQTFAKEPLKSLKIFIKVWIKIITIFFLKLNNVKIVYTIHNKESHDDKGKELTNFMADFIMRFSDVLIMLCHNTENYLKEKKNADKLLGKSIYIPHPEYSTVYKEGKKGTLRNHLAIPEDAFVVLLFGLIRPYKKIEIWLKAAEMLIDKNIYFLLAGNGNNQKYVQKIKELSQKSKKVIFINKFIKNEEIAPLFATADVLTLPYQKGSLNSGPVIAALTFGVPVICPEIGSIYDYSKEFFFCYDYLDDEDHSKKLCSLIQQAYQHKQNNIMEWEDLKQKMRAEVRQNASIDIVKQLYQDLYKCLFL